MNDFDVKQSKPSGFDDIKIGWKDQEYTIAPDRCMELLARLEAVLSPPGSGVSTLEVLTQPHKAHLTKLAKAYATALRYAGATVTDSEVYLSLAKGVSKGGAEGFDAILTLAQGLLSMFFPDWTLDENLAGDEGAVGNGQPGNLSGVELSGNTTKSASVPDGSAQEIFGD